MSTEDLASTESLVRRAQGGDRESFGVIAQRFQKRLEERVQARLSNALRGRLEPDDVVQETFGHALDSLAALDWRGEELFWRWLTGIAEHVIRNASRKRSWGLLSLEADLPGSDPSPSRRLRRKERLDRLEVSLARLTPEHREALTLSRLEGLSTKEIAARMGRSPEAVRKLITRALRELRRSFGDTQSLGLPEEGLDLRGGAR